MENKRLGVYLELIFLALCVIAGGGAGFVVGILALVLVDS